MKSRLIAFLVCVLGCETMCLSLSNFPSKMRAAQPLLGPGRQWVCRTPGDGATQRERSVLNSLELHLCQELTVSPPLSQALDVPIGPLGWGLGLLSCRAAIRLNNTCDQAVCGTPCVTNAASTPFPETEEGEPQSTTLGGAVCTLKGDVNALNPKTKAGKALRTRRAVLTETYRSHG